MAYASRLSNYTANLALAAIIQPGVTLYMGLNLSDPGQSGSGELVGGLYARASVVLGGASSGIAYNSTNVTFTGLPPINQGVLWCSFWTAITGGTYLFGGVVQGGGAYVLPWPAPPLSVTIEAGAIVVQVL